MSDVQEYRVRDYVRAERIAEDGTVFISSGPFPGKEGDFLVHREDGVYYADAEAFEAIYELVPESVSEARRFSPEGKTVEEVLQFFRENPDEIERVKELESTAGNPRKGILEYEIR